MGFNPAFIFALAIVRRSSAGIEESGTVQPVISQEKERREQFVLPLQVALKEKTNH